MYTQDKLQLLSRQELQQLAKQHGVKANIKSSDIITQIIKNTAVTVSEATTNLTKYQTSDTTVNHDNDVRKQTVNSGFSIDDQLMQQKSSKDDTGARINDYYKTELVIGTVTNETTVKLTKENKNKWNKPSYVKSLLQRLKDNPPIRSNSFQGVDYFVNKCIITIPDNAIGTKLRQFLSFEVEKIVVELPESIRGDYDNKQKVTVSYDCDDSALINLVNEQYTNNERSIWAATVNQDNYSIDVSIKPSVTKLSFKQLNTMYKKANKYYESISHDTIFSILDMLILDRSEFIKIARTPLIIAFNILLSLDPVNDYYQFIKQVRVDTLHADLMSCISLNLDNKTNRVIMLPDLDLFAESLNLSWNYNDCREHKDIQSATIARYNGTKVVKNNILSTRYKSDNKQQDTDFTDHSSRTYLSNMFLSICSDNYDLVGSRLLFELVSKGENKHGHASIAYQEKLVYDNYHDDYVYHDKTYKTTQVNQIRYSKDVVIREVNKPLLDFCKQHGIKQNKVLGRIALQTVRNGIEYLGLLYINKHGYLSYKMFDANTTNLHPEVKQYLSMHGLRDDRFVSPSRISVNWKQILNLDVVPKSKAGNISYEFTDNYPYTVI